MTFKTFSDKQTKKIAGDLAEKILHSRGRFRMPKNALIIALSGDLGAGKTTFVQGFLRAAGVKKRITSPTFVLIKNYSITKLPNYKNVFHIDCYRVKKARELSVLGAEKIFANPKNIVLIEWAEKIRRILPKKTIWIKFKHGKKINQRTINLYFYNT